MIRIIFFVFSLCITGCSSIPGFNSGYKKLSEANKQKIQYLKNQDIDSLQNDGNVYKVNARQLLEYIKEKDKVLVYDWSPRCSAECCVALDYIEKFCKEKGLILLVVMEYYDFDLMPTTANFSKPIFFIDNKYYDTDYCNKYTQRFYKELSGKSFKELNYGRHFYFENGKFEGMYDQHIIKRKNNFTQLTDTVR